MQLAFLHLNLKRNPFGEITEDERARLAVVDIDRILAALQNPHCAVQFLGEKGYGKTTHLIALRSRLSGAGYVHIPEGETRPLPEGNPIMIDEAQRLTWWQQKTLFRKKVPLVLGTGWHSKAPHGSVPSQHVARYPLRVCVAGGGWGSE